MANLKFYVANWLDSPVTGTTLRNGTGGGAPALLEHADFPMSNLVLQPRYKPWRRGGAGTSGSVEVHFSFAGVVNTYSAFGIAMHRQYVPGSGGITNVDFYTGLALGYPPTWTLRGSFAMTPADNDKLLEYTGATARHCRFVITYTGDFSCKLWVIQNTGVSDIGYEYGPGSTTSIERALTERNTILGVPLLYDVGVGPNTTRRRWVLQNLWGGTPFGILRTTIRQKPLSFLMQDVDGKFYEANVVGNDLEWHRIIAGVAGGLHDSRFELEQLP